MLCRNLPAELAFVDFDRVEGKNLLSQAFVKQSIGRNKAQALATQLRNFHNVKAVHFGVRLTEANVDELCGTADLLVDCFDNIASRQLVSAWARQHDTPLVHAGLAADGTFGLVRWDERFAPDAEDEEGQATCEGGEHLPFIGLLSAALARTIQAWLDTGDQFDRLVNLNQVT
jgi:molybdopterin-synthase adenylyltransferase